MAEDGSIFRFTNMVLDRAPQTLALLSVLGLLLVVLLPVVSSAYAAPDGAVTALTAVVSSAAGYYFGKSKKEID